VTRSRPDADTYTEWRLEWRSPDGVWREMFPADDEADVRAAFERWRDVATPVRVACRTVTRSPWGPEA
jgi:hypothetical protein